MPDCVDILGEIILKFNEMDSVGQELKRERELRGISLKEIADTTKISIRYLRALEEDKFDMLPGKFFIKSIIKTYAGYIGLDEEKILDHFHHTLQLKTKEKEEQLKEEPPPTEVPRKFKLLLRTACYFVIFITALLIIIFLTKSRKSFSILEVTLPTELLSSQELPLSTINTIIPTKRMFLEMSFHQKTWIEIISDGKLHFSGLKHPGEKISVSADDAFLIHVGNAGGFTYRINGVSGKSLGRSGQVIKNLRITFRNYDQYFKTNSDINSAAYLSNRVN
ncbi:MAG: helix-turn-helix domain-containing protein [Acidobacteriota bacterium]